MVQEYIGRGRLTIKKRIYNMTENNYIDFGGGIKNSIIKVVGVGGGGGNAVNHMYREGIHDVSFLLCNTDNQALNNSPVPSRLQLGKEGLGAGNCPEKARQAAEESADDIKKMLDDGTRMAFITAGMGGGTGTGAAPVVARISKGMGILTVGIVTIPFLFEGKKKIEKALDGVEKMAKNVDALLVINNERLREIYNDASVLTAFGKADDTLSIAAKSIAEIITVHGLINLDFNDVKTVLKDGGVALMSTGYGEGEGRVKNAIENAIKSPLLNDNDVFNSQKILLNITTGESSATKEGLMMDEMSEVHEFMNKFKSDFEIKWGLATDPDLGDKIKITILATGFGLEIVEGLGERIKQLTREQIIERQNRTDELEAKIEQIYGPQDGRKRIKHRINCYTFQSEDLDDDNIISSIEDTPTYKRPKSVLANLHSSSTKEDEPVVVVAQPSDSTNSPSETHTDSRPGEPIQTTIVFS